MMGVWLSWERSSRTLGLQSHPYPIPTSTHPFPQGAESCLTPVRAHLWERLVGTMGLEIGEYRGQADRKGELFGIKERRKQKADIQREEVPH